MELNASLSQSSGEFNLPSFDGIRCYLIKKSSYLLPAKILPHSLFMLPVNNIRLGVHDTCSSLYLFTKHE